MFGSSFPVPLHWKAWSSCWLLADKLYLRAAGFSYAQLKLGCPQLKPGCAQPALIFAQPSLGCGQQKAGYSQLKAYCVQPNASFAQ
jgi:hypothetical protein